MSRDDLQTAANDALQRGRWSEAVEAFEAVLKEGDRAHALLGLGQALWWLGETKRSVDFHERAYGAFRRMGDVDNAAWAALWIGLTFGSDFGNAAAFNGWVGRAERLLQGTQPGPIHGRLWLTRAYDTSDLARSRELTERVLDLAREHSDLDLELCALAHLGHILVAADEVEEGLSLIDEAMAGAFGGERTRFDTVVFAGCGMIAACESASDIERATQWCQVTDAFIREYGCPFLRAQCRTGYGGILAATGHWLAAESELTTAVHLTKDTYPPLYSAALSHLAQLRLDQGRLEEAEELLADVEGDLSCAVPAAKAKLVRGETVAAVALLRRSLDFLGGHHAQEALILELLVDAYLAQDDLDAAAETASLLQDLATHRKRDLLKARAAAAYGRVLVAQEARSAAIGYLQQAAGLFLRLRMPLQEGRARMELAKALGVDELEVAIVEANNALRLFDSLGAKLDADGARAFLRSLGAPANRWSKQAGALTEREQEVLRLIGLGLSNPEIAERLCISRKTAGHHVSHVLTKPGLRNRGQATAYLVRTERSNV
jgi:DNA-binding CsgD family transcriptional regulator